MGKISHIDHIAIVVRSINEVSSFYEDALGMKIERIEDLPERGIRTAFIPVGLTYIELIEPLHDQSEVSKFLQKRGPGLHHIAFKTNDIEGLEIEIKEAKAELTYEKVKPGAHNTLVNFIHPKSSGGVLMEIVS